MKICALLPIKHSSSRVPGKNYRDFNGKPLFMIILNTLLKVKQLDDIIIDTNSDLVKKLVKENYSDDKKIRVYDRPEHLWDGDIPMNRVLENVITDLKLDHDFFFQTHTTNPLLKPETIIKSIEIFFKKFEEGYDSLFSVKKWQTRLYKLVENEVVALNHNPNELLPTQDLEPLYEENSCIYIFNKENLLKKQHRIGYKPFMFVMDDIESSDIDIETDFVIAENIHKNLVLNKNSEKNVLITGANGGIGTELCKKFKKEGWQVIGTSIEDDCKHSHINKYVKANLTNSQDIKILIENIKNEYGKLDCLINNAASQICKPIWDMEENEWDNVFDCNLKSIFLMVKYGVELMKNRGSNIINIGSVHSLVTSNEIAAYATSKAAIVGLTRNLAIELSRFGIRVNSISPGAINTRMLREGLKRGHVEGSNEDELVKKLGSSHLLGKVGEPNEIANLAEFLANTNGCSFVNGANIVVDGGASIKLSTE